MTICQLAGCENPVKQPVRGRPRTYCSDKCRNRAGQIRFRDSGRQAERARRLYAEGKKRMACSLCGEPTGWAAHQGPENPICQSCRRQRAMRICENKNCQREFIVLGDVARKQRFCSRKCWYAVCRKYDDRQASSKADSRRRKLRHNQTWDGITDTQIFERDNWKCRIPECGRGPIHRDLAFPSSLSASIDHIVPLSRGGTDTAPNKRAAHLICNVKRGNRMHPEDMQIITPELAPLGLLPPRKRPAQLRFCADCGNVPVKGKTARCTECRAAAKETRRQQALKMRQQGSSWEQIAAALKLSGPGAAYNVVYPPWARYA